MRIAYFDCFGGISGDMCLGALVSAGVELKHIEEQLKRAGIAGFKISSHTVHKKSIGATQVVIEFNEISPPACHLKDIQSIIHNSTLSEWAKNSAQKVFSRLAKAEAQVHNIPIEHVHFHEVGALDAIIDIIGTILGLEMLGIDKIYASALPFGRGPIYCQHGILPNPAPATLELCRGIPMYDTGIEGELVTPTGAALISTLADHFGILPRLKVDQIGYGAGSKEMTFPNVLRLWIGNIDTSESEFQLLDNPNEIFAELQSPLNFSSLSEDQGTKSLLLENIYILECTIDDMNAEWFTYLRNRLEQAGALEIIYRQVQMKKNRPGIELCVLAKAASISKIVRVILGESTSLGVRLRRDQRLSLPREISDMDTPIGPIKVKWTWAPRVQGGWYRRGKPEFESCRHLAEKLGMTLPEVYTYIINCLGTAEK